METKEENKGISITIPIILSVISLLFSYKNYTQLVPLNQSNIVFDEKSILVSQINDEKGNTSDVIKPIFKNIGKSSAKNIRIRVYMMPFSNLISIGAKEFGSLIEMFDESYVHELSSNTESVFGSTSLGHTSKEGKNLEGQEIAIIYEIEYYDNFNGDKKQQFFVFKYKTGEQSVFSMTGGDFKKISDRLIKQAELLNNQDLNKYLKERNFYLENLN